MPGLSSLSRIKRLMEKQMKTTSIESVFAFEEKLGLAYPCEPYSQGSDSGPNGVAQLPATATATLHRQSEDAQRFLLESSGEFVSSDSETTLKRLAIQAVPFLADFCFFDVVATDGTIRRVSWRTPAPSTTKSLSCSMNLSQYEAPSMTPSARYCALANLSSSRKSTMPGCGESPRVSGTSSSCVSCSSAR